MPPDHAQAVLVGRVKQHLGHVVRDVQLARRRRERLAGGELGDESDHAVPVAPLPGDVVGDAEVKGIDRCVFRLRGRDHDDGQRGVALAHARQGLNACPAPQLVVQDEDTEAALGQQLECSLHGVRVGRRGVHRACGRDHGGELISLLAVAHHK